MNKEIKYEYAGLKCPKDCKFKDKMCHVCVDGSYFDANAQKGELL